MLLINFLTQYVRLFKRLLLQLLIDIFGRHFIRRQMFLPFVQRYHFSVTYLYQVMDHNSFFWLRSLVTNIQSPNFKTTSKQTSSEPYIQMSNGARERERATRKRVRQKEKKGMREREIEGEKEKRDRDRDRAVQFIQGRAIELERKIERESVCERE